MVILSRSLIFYVTNNKTNLNILKCDIVEPRKGDFLKLLDATIASNAVNLQLFLSLETLLFFHGELQPYTTSPKFSLNSNWDDTDIRVSSRGVGYYYYVFSTNYFTVLFLFWSDWRNSGVRLIWFASVLQILYNKMLLMINIMWNGDCLTFTIAKHSMDFSVILITVYPCICSSCQNSA